MSLILEALDKADHEEQAPERAPTLRTRYFARVSDVSVKPPRFPPLAIGIIAALVGCVLLLLLAYVTKSQPQSQPQSPPQPLNAQDMQTPVPPTQPALTTAPVSITVPSSHRQPAPEREVLADTSSVSNVRVATVEEQTSSYSPDQSEIAALYTNAGNKDIVIEPSAVPPQAFRNRQTDELALAQKFWDESKPQPASAALPNATSQPKSVAVPKPAVPVVVQPIEEPVVGPSVTALTDILFLHELPVSIQNSIPTLMYAAHEYNGGYVVMNKKRYMPGDAVAKGLVLNDLLADGVVLSVNGKQFKLSALNSWVNY